MTAAFPSSINAAWRELDPTLSFHADELRDLVALWEDQRGAADLPHRDRVSPFDLKSILGWVILVDVEHAPERYRFRLIGSSVTQLLGRDSTGRYLDDVLDPAMYDPFVAAHRYVCAHRRPVRCTGTLIHANKAYIDYESVLMPYAGDDGLVDLCLEGMCVPA